MCLPSSPPKVPALPSLPPPPMTAADPAIQQVGQAARAKKRTLPETVLTGPQGITRAAPTKTPTLLES